MSSPGLVLKHQASRLYKLGKSHRGVEFEQSNIVYTVAFIVGVKVLLDDVILRHPGAVANEGSVRYTEFDLFVAAENIEEGK